MSAEWSERPLAERQEFLRRFADTNDPGMRRELLEPLVAPGSNGIYTSKGELFQFSIFGRDSAEVGEDIYAMGDFEHHIAHNIIMTLARLQGVQNDPDYSEEQPGKIHHEYRSRMFAGEPVPERSQKIITELREKPWAAPESDPDVLCYYGSVDPTPLFIRLVSDYADHYGDSILSQRTIGRDEKRRTIGECVARAADFLYDEIGRSRSGLLEFRRTNPKGLLSQSWKDSPNAYLHEDGTKANYEGGVASIDVQGYAYDALVKAARLLPAHPNGSSWLARAQDLQRRTNQQLWMPDEKYYAQGLDYDESEQPRQIKTITSDAGVLLATDILDGPQYTSLRESVIKRIASPEFMTEVGLRQRALGHSALVPFIDYHGSRVSWPKHTSTVAVGLARHRHLASRKLSRTLIESAIRSGDFYEFYRLKGNEPDSYVYDTTKSKSFDFAEGQAGTPEPYQAWTVSAFLGAVHRRHERLA